MDSRAEGKRVGERGMKDWTGKKGAVSTLADAVLPLTRPRAEL